MANNAVYGQLFGALIAYLLLKWLFDTASASLPRLPYVCIISSVICSLRVACRMADLAFSLVSKLGEDSPI
ncbi:hypothetical protein D3C81_880260 [compost metagenome]